MCRTTPFLQPKMTEQLSSLLSNCDNEKPPFENIIRETLNTLPGSRFQFAIQLQQKLEASKETLTSTQQLCILCTIYDIGSGVSKPKKKKSVSIATNAFLSYLLQKEECIETLLSDVDFRGNLAFLQQLKAYSHNHKDDQETENDTRLEKNQIIQNSMQGFYRPSPLFTAEKLLDDGISVMPEMNLQFLQTTFPTLRYHLIPDVTHDEDEEKPSPDLLLQQMFVEPLEVEAEETVLSYCDSTGNGLELLTPDNLPSLVEQNPNIAIHLLLEVENEQQVNVYHSKLVHMEITLHAMEVVYKLATLDDSPCKLNAEYLHVFILGLLDRGSQDLKMVRLISVFLQNLIQNGIVHVDEFLSAEIQSFCIENARIREAQCLFKLLKERGNGNSKSSTRNVSTSAGKRNHKDKGKK